MLVFRNHIITMPEYSTALQKLTNAQDALVKLKEAQAFFDLFDLVIYRMSYTESKRPEIVQLELLKDAYASNASALIEEMENHLQDIHKELR